MVRGRGRGNRPQQCDTALSIIAYNLQQREKLLPNEKAFAYKMKLEAIKRQGERTDLALAQVA